MFQKIVANIVRYYFGRYLFELAELVPFPYFQGMSTCCSGR